MQRYFVPRDNWDENQVLINGDDAHHISRVMRLLKGDRIVCVHPDGRAAVSVIISVENQAVYAEIAEWLAEEVELPIQITIAQGLAKGDKMDVVLQKGTELGADAFIPLKTDRSVVVWDKKKAEKKMKRFSKIVKEAGEQSQRTKLPLVKETMSVPELIDNSMYYDMKLFAYEEEAKTSAFQSFGIALNKLEKGDHVLICVGPEGGFSQKEAELLKANGFISTRLGPRILRTETAALYALASISYHFEEMRCQ